MYVVRVFCMGMCTHIYSFGDNNKHVLYGCIIYVNYKSICFCDRISIEWMYHVCKIVEECMLV